MSNLKEQMGAINTLTLTLTCRNKVSDYGNVARKRAEGSR